MNPDISKVLDEILPLVSKPARYLGNEWNTVRKDHDKVQVRFALAFPDVYEIGMSNLGLAIMYHEINSRDDALAERVYAPWVDMESEMRQRGVPLFSLETRTPIKRFDILGFGIPYEVSYTNILNMLDLAGIPLRQSLRKGSDPFIIAGGGTALNAEPLTDFIDFFVLGDGEEVIHEIIDCFKDWDNQGRPGGRVGFLERAVSITGVYVPSFYDVEYDVEGWITSIAPNRSGVPARVSRRIVADLDRLTPPTSPIVPWTGIVFDRMMVEVFRGCSRGCRFCHAGFTSRPVRERSPEKVKELARELVRRTGHQEVSLVSLATNDYSQVRDVLCELAGELEDQGVNVSLPSLRVDAYSIGLANEVNKVRKSGLTLAPEAGTQRLRDVINKGVTDEDYERALTAAFAAGWDSLKLYFMIGLPTERDEDLHGIAEMAKRAVDIYHRVTGRNPRGHIVTVSTACFIPKPHTPFQWEGQVPLEELERRQRLLRLLLRHRNIQYRWNDTKGSFIEAALSRGDRRLGDVLHSAWQKGCKFDAWSDQLKYDAWLAAFKDVGLDPGWYANRRVDYNRVLPWDHIDTGIRKEFLIDEHMVAMRAGLRDDCRWDRCHICGVCIDRPGVRTRIKPHGSVKMPKPGARDEK